MMKISTAAVLLICAWPTASAQSPQKPTPTAEHKRLGYFVGTWTQQGDLKAGPLGPGGKMTGTETCEWFTGGFHVVCRSAGKGPMGDLKGLGLLSYNTEEKTYVFQGIDSTGMMDSGKGTVDGKTWTFTSEEKMGGKLIHSRYSMTETSPTSYVAKWEMSEDGKNWMTAMEMKAAKAAPKK